MGLRSKFTLVLFLLLRNAKSENALENLGFSVTVYQKFFLSDSMESVKKVWWCNERIHGHFINLIL